MDISPLSTVRISTVFGPEEPASPFQLAALIHALSVLLLATIPTYQFVHIKVLGADNTNEHRLP